MMLEYDMQYPGYGFKDHKGYGVAKHVAAIHRLGPTPIHRKSFQPVKGILGWERPAPPDEEDHGKIEGDGSAAGQKKQRKKKAAAAAAAAGKKRK